MTEFNDRRYDDEHGLNALKHIESRDPNGGEKQPTKADYANHKKWAISQYGQQTWKTYSKGGWDPQYQREV